MSAHSLKPTVLRSAPTPAPAVPGGALVAAIERLAGARSTEDVVETLRSTARRLVGSDGISIVLRDGDKCHYVEEDAIGPLWKGGKFPMTSCISGWAMMNAKTAVIPDIFADDRIPHALYRERFVRSLVMAPIGWNEPLAAIGAYWAKTYTPTQSEIDTIQTLARAAATALENARLIGALSASLRKTELARDDLHHRLKNAFVAVDAIADLILPKLHKQAFSERIAALSRAYSVLDQKLHNRSVVALADLVDAELEPYRGIAPGKIDVSGASVTLEVEQAVALGLTLNELATNAVNAGALGAPNARLKIRWREEARVIRLDWEESGGPSVKTSAVETFGSRLMRLMIEGQLKGMIRRTVSETRVNCTIEFPNLAAVDFPPNG